MQKIKEVFLMILIIALAVMIFIKYSAPAEIIEKIITKNMPTVKTITINGTYERPDNPPENWALILQEKPSGNYEIIKEDLPQGMKTTSIITEKKTDWLQVFRIGAKCDRSGNIEAIISANVNIYKGIELGIALDKKSAGLVAGYKYRNIFAGYYYGITDKSAGITLQAKLF